MHHILADPVYTGTAYVNRYEYLPSGKLRSRKPAYDGKGLRRLRPREQGIAIPVPALVEQGPVRVGPDGTAPRPSSPATPRCRSATTCVMTASCAAC